MILYWLFLETVTKIRSSDLVDIGVSVISEANKLAIWSFRGLDFYFMPFILFPNGHFLEIKKKFYKPCF